MLHKKNLTIDQAIAAKNEAILLCNSFKEIIQPYLIDQRQTELLDDCFEGLLAEYDVEIAHAEVCGRFLS